MNKATNDTKAADSSKLNQRLLFFQAQVECLERHIQAAADLIRNRPYRSAFPSGDERLITRTGIQVKVQAKNWSSNPERTLTDNNTIKNWIENLEGDVSVLYSRNETIAIRAQTKRQWAAEKSEAIQRDQESYNRDVLSLISRTTHTSRSMRLKIADALSSLDAQGLEELLSDMKKELHQIKRSTEVELSQQASPIELINSMVSEIYSRRPETKTSLLYLHGMDIQEITEIPVAAGGYANVFRGKWHGEAVALKVLKFSPNEKEKFTRRFNKESTLWSSLKHDCVLEFYGVYRLVHRSLGGHDQFYMVSPWMENGNIMSFCAQNPDVDRMALLVQVADGLRYLHSRESPVIHGDLKGDNVLITSNGTAVLVDFGLAAIEDDMQVWSSINRGGGVRWMAPELIDDGEESEAEVPKGPTRESDVYAFGMTALQVLTGKLPYDELPQRTFDMNVINAVTKGHLPKQPMDCSAITDTIWILFTRCWWFNPQGRPSIETVYLDLQKIHAKKSRIHPEFGTIGRGV